MSTTYLARILLNPHSRAVQRDLHDAVMLHRTLMKLVPDGLGESARKQAGLLFRLEETERTSTLLVQAATQFDPAALPADYGRIEVKNLTPMFRALTPGLNLRYRIAANPAKRQRLPLDDERKRGPIKPLNGPEADQWWIRRAATAGLQVHTLLPTPVRILRSRVKEKEGMRHQLVRFDGIATVTDPEALSEAVRTGIGKGKPYGAGLLSLAPAAAS